MVEARLTLEPEVQEIFRCIDEGRNFVLSGGAGSGKTYSLVSVIRQVLAEHPTAKVACMTYTNAAVREIEERVDHKNLHVSTLHDFLWDCIKHFQKELKEALATLINDPDWPKIVVEGIDEISPDYFVNGIQYREHRRIREGFISHDEVLVVAHYLFKKYTKLNDIVKDKYRYVFIDEYQDTSKLVIDIFLNSFKKSSKKSVIGFFGDAMQSIYDDSIGSLKAYTGEDNETVKEVKKNQNRRNPRLIINLANQLRTDGIEQEPSRDLNAPNMLNGVVKEGNIIFLYTTDKDVTIGKQLLEDKYGWNFSNTDQTKELNLTHNLIAGKAGFSNLMDIYDGDSILDYRKRIKDYIKKNNITEDFSGYTFQQVIDALKAGKADKEVKLIMPTPSMQAYIDLHSERYEHVLQMDFTYFCSLYVDKEQLIDDKKQYSADESKKGSKRDHLIKHLYKIQKNIDLYTSGKFNEFLQATDYRSRLLRVEDKRVLKENIEQLVNVGDKTIEVIIAEANRYGICLIDDYLTGFQEKKPYVYNQVKEVKFSEFQKLYTYLEGKTPFSTQHKTKGTEFDNVLVILDNGNWRNYNFAALFSSGTTKQGVLEASQKIFYVCCTRAKEKLAVFYKSPDAAVINQAQAWFGADNVVEV